MKTVLNEEASINREFIDKQFNMMRSQLLGAAELVITDEEKLNKLKSYIKDITGNSWDNFSVRFVDIVNR